MLSKEPSKRPSATEIKEIIQLYPWDKLYLTSSGIRGIPSILISEKQTELAKFYKWGRQKSDYFGTINKQAVDVILSEKFKQFKFLNYYKKSIGEITWKVQSELDKANYFINTLEIPNG